MQIAAGKFKAQCLQIMDKVQREHCSVVITKRGKPCAKLVPAEEEPTPALFGYLGGKLQIEGDIVGPLNEAWDADA